MTMRFAGKSVIVTGAASGIGRAMTGLFAGEGAKVLAVDLADELESAVSGIAGVTTMRGNAGFEADVAAMVETAIARNGGLDVFCANAGVSGGRAGLFEQTAEDWEALLRTNLVGPFLAIKYGTQAMLDAGKPGCIVCTASVAGLRAGAGGPAYSASKAGVINLVQSAAQQLTGTGIRVNAICPGLIESGMTRGIYEAARKNGREEMIGQLNPMRRGGEPIEIANAAAYLASDAASYVNGHALVVDGGLSTSHPFAKPRAVGETTF